MEHYIKLKPISNDVKRPLWSVLIPTHNCAHYLKETLISVLQQYPGEDKMEIIVIDDYSTLDDPESVVKQYGQGCVQFIRQKQNVGKVKNYETGLQASKGIYIHQLHGDDKVRPGFYATMEELLKKYPDAGAAFSRTIYIDHQGRWTGLTGMVENTEGIVPNMLERLYIEQLIQTPSMVVKREVYVNIGCFDRRLNCMEDREMWIRIANSYPIINCNEVLAEYRSHSANATNETFIDGSALDTQSLLSEIINAYLPQNLVQKNNKIRRKKNIQFLILSYNARMKTLNFKSKLKIISKMIRLRAQPIDFYRLLK
jgi:glycosyltransferase involved in cell wall biosynthesis